MIYGKRLNNGEITPARAKREIEELQREVAQKLEKGEINLNKRSDDQPPKTKESKKDDKDQDNFSRP